MGQRAAQMIETIQGFSPPAHRVVEAIQKGDIEEAKQLYKDISLPAGNEYEAVYLEALISHKSGDLGKAIDLMYKVVQMVPGFEQAIFNLGVMLEESNRFDAALEVYQHLLKQSPKYPQALFNIAHIYRRGGLLKEAEQYYRKFLEQSPYHSNANSNLGALLIDQGRFDEALPYCEKAVMLELDNFNARNNCGIIYAQRGDFAKAEKAFKQVLKMQPDYEPAKRNLEVIEKQKANPQAPLAKNNLVEIVQKGNTHLAAREYSEAEQAYRSALIIQPDIVEVLINLSMALNMQRRFGESEAMLKRALMVQPANADAYGNLGNLYRDQERFDEAVKAYEKALEINPDAFKSLVNMGMTFEQMGKHEKAIDIYRKAVERDPKQMLEMYPNHAAALARIILEQQQLCLWDGLDDYKAKLEALVKDQKNDLRESYRGFLVSTLSSIAADPMLQKHAAEQAAQHNYGAVAKPYDVKAELPHASRKGGKIRIGYASADFYQHATAYLIAGLFEQHDRSRFEIYVYSYGKDDKSAIRRRIEKSADRFIDVSGMSDKQASEQVQKNGIDILVDLKGYTKDHRLGMLATRPAPIQVHYLGYPGTIGAPFIDYFIADKVAATHAEHFSEKLAYLPHSYQINDSKRQISSSIPSRADCGLPEQGFVFCSFNQNYKITPKLFDVWMRLLSSVPGSVLWLYITNEVAMDNLRMEAKKRGVDASRLVFASYMPLAEHLARCSHIDLFLDTSPINAHTTASDALWAGVPMVTYGGETFIGRVAASLLTAAGMQELVSNDLASYEALALKIAKDPGQLAALKQKAQAAKNSPLFDTKATTQAIENAYLEMIERHKQGKMPETFEVKA